MQRAKNSVGVGSHRNTGQALPIIDGRAADLGAQILPEGVLDGSIPILKTILITITMMIIAKLSFTELLRVM